MAKTTRQETGDWGERAAEAYLRKEKGMRVLARQWRHGRGEVDLVMRRGRMVVFVEVRVRGGGGFPASPYFSIGRHKWEVLRRTARAFLRELSWRPVSVRFDVVGIRRLRNGQPGRLVHWENAGRFERELRY